MVNQYSLDFKLKIVKMILNENVAIMARTEGLSYNLDKIQATSTNDAHRLLKWTYENNKGKELTEKLFEGYFTLGLNIADHEPSSI